MTILDISTLYAATVMPLLHRDPLDRLLGAPASPGIIPFSPQTPSTLTIPELKIA